MECLLAKNEDNQQKFQPDNSFVIKPAKRFAFFTQVLRQSATRTRITG
jgi:hypothetical protein